MLSAISTYTKSPRVIFIPYLKFILPQEIGIILAKLSYGTTGYTDQLNTHL